MFRSHRSEFFALGIVALVVAAVGIWSWPEFPTLDGYSYGSPRNANYQPGGKPCQPSAIAAIRDKRTASAKAIACQKEAEEYRQNTDDLVQQTRAADAAEAQTSIASQSLWMSWFQTLGGVLTLAAAGAAAWYARDAAREARRGANVAEGQLDLANNANAADLRPYLFVSKIIPKVEDDGLLDFEIVLQNYGKLPARNILIQHHTSFTSSGSSISSGVLSEPKIDIPICAPGHERRVFQHYFMNEEEQKAFNAGFGSIIIRIRYRYKGGPRKRPYAERVDYSYSRSSAESGHVYIISSMKPATADPIIPNLLDDKVERSDG